LKMKTNNEYITLDIIYSAVEKPEETDGEFPIQLMSFIVKDKYPYNKCKTFLDVIKDNIFGEIISHNITPIEEMAKVKLLSTIDINTTIH
jgi:hypothetical protein